MAAQFDFCSLSPVSACGRLELMCFMACSQKDCVVSLLSSLMCKKRGGKLSRERRAEASEQQHYTAHARGVGVQDIHASTTCMSVVTAEAAAVLDGMVSNSCGSTRMA